ncbi:unnamed protein product [Leuciscus chuanchicus]
MGSRDATKICSHCKKEQRLKKKLQRFEEKREEWVVGRKKNHNIASIKDRSHCHDCSYQTHLEAFPIRSVGRERVRKIGYQLPSILHRIPLDLFHYSKDTKYDIQSTSSTTLEVTQGPYPHKPSKQVHPSTIDERKTLDARHHGHGLSLRLAVDKQAVRGHIGGRGRIGCSWSVGGAPGRQLAGTGGQGDRWAVHGHTGD